MFTLHGPIVDGPAKGSNANILTICAIDAAIPGPITVSPSVARTSNCSRANTYRLSAETRATNTDESDLRDPWVTSMRTLATNSVSNTLAGRPRPIGPQYIDI